MVSIESMPKFGLSMEEGVVSEWLRPVGSRVSRGDAVVTIEAEKLVNDAKAPREGVVLHYFLAVGDTAPCGAPLYALGDEGDVYEPGAAEEDKPASKAPAQPFAQENKDALATARARAVAAQHGVSLSTLRGTGTGGEITVDDVRRALDAPASQENTVASEGDVRVTPRARILAQKQNLSYNHIKGTGLLGMVTVADIKAHGRPVVEAAGTRIPMNGVQRATAVAMKKSLENAAQTVVCVEESYGKLAAAYRRLKPVYAARGVKLSYTAMIIKAAAAVLSERPDIRMQYADASHFLLPAGIHIGMAVEVEKGLLVPVIRDADKKTLEAICRDVAALSKKAHAGELTETDMGGAVMTVTNLAMAGVTLFTPILNPPESTILGVCVMRDKPVVRDGGIYIEPVMNLCLTYDHRVVNGAPAGRFVREIATRLNTIEWE